MPDEHDKDKLEVIASILKIIDSINATPKNELTIKWDSEYEHMSYDNLINIRTEIINMIFKQHEGVSGENKYH